jgi:hypothetical protein
MERVRRARTVGRWIGEEINNLELLDDRAGPAVADDQRQGVVVFRADVNEMNVETVDLGGELRQGVQLCLDLAPVVVPSPNSAGGLESPQAERLAFHPRRFPARASGSPRCAVLDRRAALPAR